MITTAYAPLQYAGNDSTKAFSVTWPYFADTDLVVTIRDDTTGVDTLQTISTHYTATTPSPAPGTGTVTFVTAPASGETVVIERAVPLTQQIDYVEDDSFPASSHEEALDRALMHAQERKSDVDHTPKFPASDPAASIGDFPSSIARASGYAGYDTDGKPTVYSAAVSMTGVSPFMETVLDDADAATARGTLVVAQADPNMDRIGSGGDSGKWNPGVYDGVYFARDTRRVYVSYSGAWYEMTLAHFARASLPAAAAAGQKYLDTTLFGLWYDDGANLKPIRHLAPGYRDGCHVAYASATTFTVSVGAFRDSADLANLILASALTKTVNTSGDWGAGASGNAFGLTSPAPTSAWRRVFLIGKDDGSVDVGCDAASNAANLLSDSGYDWYKRIGWIYLDGSKQLISSYVTGNWTWWSVPQIAHNDTGDQDYTAGNQISFVMVPPSVVARGLVAHTNLTGVAILLGGDQSCAAPQAAANPIGAFVTGGQPVYYDVPVNNSNQVYVRTSAGETTIQIDIDVHGWFDDRLVA